MLGVSASQCAVCWLLVPPLLLPCSPAGVFWELCCHMWDIEGGGSSLHGEGHFVYQQQKHIGDLLCAIALEISN